MKRDSYLDGLKFLLIFSIMWVHAMQFNAWGSEIAVKIIHSYIMPMFVLLSGYFSRIGSDEKLLKWLRKTFTIFVIFHLGLIVLEICLGRNLEWSMLYVPEFALWYMVSLIFWRVSLHLLAKIKIYPSIKMLVISICLIFVTSFIPLDLELSFQRTFVFFPFFLVGYLLRDHEALPLIMKVKPWVAVVLALVALVAVFILPSFVPKFHFTRLIDLGVRMSQLATSLVVCFCVFRLVPHGFVKKFHLLGKDTMYFYLYHTFFILIQRHICEVYGFDKTLNVLFGFLLALLYTGIIMVIKRFRIFRMPMLEK